jgi:hypothetical protein
MDRCITLKEGKIIELARKGQALPATAASGSG